MDSREFEEHSRRINKFLNQRDASPSKSAELTERIIDELSRAIAQMTPEQNPQEWSQAELRGREYLAQAKEQKKITLFTQCVSDFRAALAGKIEVGRSENVWLHIAMASQDNARLT